MNGVRKRVRQTFDQSSLLADFVAIRSVGRRNDDVSLGAEGLDGGDGVFATFHLGALLLVREGVGGRGQGEHGEELHGGNVRCFLLNVGVELTDGGLSGASVSVCYKGLEMDTVAVGRG